MSGRRNPPGRRPGWTISVLSPDGQRQIFHAATEDREEIKALATEARAHCLRYQIWITDPFGQVEALGLSRQLRESRRPGSILSEDTSKRAAPESP